MAIKRGSKVDKSFSSASMTDLMFLLLVFLLMATTLINPNAIKVVLPKSSNQLKDKAITTVTIQKTATGVNYYVETQPAKSLDELESLLRERLAGRAHGLDPLRQDGDRRRVRQGVGDRPGQRLPDAAGHAAQLTRKRL